MNRRYIVDAYAWIEYLDGSVEGVKVRDLVEAEENAVYTCAVTIAEVISKFIRRRKDPKTAFVALTSNSHVIPVDADLSEAAGHIHAEWKARVRDFGLADAYVLAGAEKYQATVVTGDPHFKAVPGVLTITKR